MIAGPGKNNCCLDLLYVFDFATFLIFSKKSSYFFLTGLTILVRKCISFDGASPSGKAPDFDSGIPRFESWRPSHFKVITFTY